MRNVWKHGQQDMMLYDNIIFVICLRPPTYFWNASRGRLPKKKRKKSGLLPTPTPPHPPTPGWVKGQKFTLFFLVTFPNCHKQPSLLVKVFLFVFVFVFCLCLCFCLFAIRCGLLSGQVLGGQEIIHDGTADVRTAILSSQPNARKKDTKNLPQHIFFFKI